MAKQLTTYTRVVNRLAKIYKYANEEFFNNELPTPTITVQSSATSYAHISTQQVWSNGTDNTYELNISADYMDRPIESVVASLLHEMTHLYIMVIEGDQKGGTSNGYYHTKHFKEVAEELAKIQIDKDARYGFTITSPTEDTINFCIEYDLEDVQLARKSDLTINFGGKAGATGTQKPRTKKPSSTRKYVCPCCRTTFRATKEIRVMCMDCNEQFVLA